jgi:hypothetical protein
MVAFQIMNAVVKIEAVNKNGAAQWAELILKSRQISNTFLKPRRDAKHPAPPRSLRRRGFYFGDGEKY